MYSVCAVRMGECCWAYCELYSTGMICDVSQDEQARVPTTHMSLVGTKGGSTLPQSLQGRVIGIRHRVKKTAAGEARPTMVYDLSSKSLMELKTEQDELDFVRKLLQPGDRIAMVLGGSGDSLAYALSRAGESADAKVFRIPSFRLKEERGTAEKDDDAKLLAELLKRRPELFYEVRSRDRALIEVIECYRARQDAMKARIACEQRLRASFIGKIFRNREGQYPEGEIEDAFDAEKASNTIHSVLVAEEGGRERDLTNALKALDVYNEIFAHVEGCGMSISAGIIAAVGDIRRFGTKAKLKAFLGAHVLEDGRFARRRAGELANWNPAGRQALYLLADQMKRRPDSVWGRKVREYIAKFRVTHPEPVVVNGKKRYGDGHIFKMAQWRSATKFVEWLFTEWWKLEGGQAVDEAQAAA